MVDDLDVSTRRTEGAFDRPGRRAIDMALDGRVEFLCRGLIPVLPGTPKSAICLDLACRWLASIMIDAIVAHGLWFCRSSPTKVLNAVRICWSVLLSGSAYCPPIVVGFPVKFCRAS